MSRAKTSTPSNISTADLAKSQKEQKEAELLLKQMRKRVNTLRGGHATNLNASISLKEQASAKRSEEVREMRKETANLLEIRRKEEARRLRKSTQAEKDRKEQSRNQMYVAFQKKLSDVVYKNDEWKTTASQYKKERDDWRKTMHQMAVQEKQVSRGRRSRIIADIEESKRMARDERITELQENKLLMEQRAAWQAEENAINVSRVKEVQHASVEAKRKVEERNQQARTEQLSALKKVRDEEMARMADELEELRREEAMLQGGI